MRCPGSGIVSVVGHIFKLLFFLYCTERLVRLVDEITFKLAGEAHDTATASAILGPFFRHDAPELPNESSIVHGVDDGEMTYMYGHVRDAKTGLPVTNAVVDVWQASTNGLYEQQDDNQVDCNLRGKFKTNENGRYAFYCLRPTPYPIPNDGKSNSLFIDRNIAKKANNNLGPGGKILELLDRHPMRPAHIHLIAIKAGYKPITTQVFDSKSPYLEDDSVFAVKSSLVVDFVPLEDNAQAKLQLKYDIALIPNESGL